jgi:3-oxoacyl-[acyl-carrier-protein] synthase-3
MTKRIGIVGIGVYLPDEVRPNSWWSAATVARWRQRSTRSMQHETLADAPTEGARAVLRALAAYADDPFKGAIERRVAPAGMSASEMEVRAARDAITRSGGRVDDIAVCLVHSVTPDFIHVPNACRVHHELGLPEACFTMSVDGMCNAFQLQLTLAQALLRGHPGKRALLVQSGTLPRLTPSDEPVSAWVGEGATAVLVGEVADELGLLASAHYTDGSKFDGLVCGVEGKQWYEEGVVRAYAHNRKTAQRVILDVADHARQAIHAVLSSIGAAPTDVRFYAAHQGTVWLRATTQAYCGLENAMSVDTFSRFGSLSAGNLPLVLAFAERDRMLSEGDLVMMFSGGSGETWSATALRWGVG